jgi:serine/threonine-protein kinase
MSNITPGHYLPKQIGRYEIVSELGRGGNAIVYRAYDPLIRRQVAVKILKDTFLEDDKYKERFRREVQTIAKLEHPAIVPVYDFGEENSKPYIVMRLMPGKSLGDRLNSEKISLEEAINIIARLALALDMAHAEGIIHRDLKPDNILFDDNNQAHIADFGIARIVKTTTEWTTGGIIGTPAYMSPEQVQDVKDIDARSDVYSLGIIFYQMLAGTPPFKSDTTPASVLLMHIRDPVPSLLDSRPDLPIEINDILQKALAKEPDDRFLTAGELAAALLAVVETEWKTLPSDPNQKSTLHKFIIPGISLIFIIFVVLGIGLIAPKLIAGKSTSTTTSTPPEVALIATSTNPSVSITSTPPPQPSSTPIPVASPTDTEQDTETPNPEELSTTGVSDGIKISPKDTMTQIYIPEGEFVMGQYSGRDNPQHPVYLDAYWMDQTEVTNAQFALCVADGKCEPPRLVSSATRSNYYGNEAYSDFPVIEVSWLQAKNYCLWAGRNLPTEAQWEKAARGTDGRRHPWGDERLTRDLINFGNDVYKDTVDVFSLPRDSSFYDVLMMGGNVSEWVLDWYGETYYADSVESDGVANNPQGPFQGDDGNIVMRGSSWISSDAPNTGARVDVRYPTNPNLQLNYIGFRCAEPAS